MQVCYPQQEDDWREDQDQTARRVQLRWMINVIISRTDIPEEHLPLPEIQLADVSLNIPLGIFYTFFQREVS